MKALGNKTMAVTVLVKQLNPLFNFHLRVTTRRVTGVPCSWPLMTGWTLKVYSTPGVRPEMEILPESEVMSLGASPPWLGRTVNWKIGSYSFREERGQGSESMEVNVFPGKGEGGPVEDSHLRCYSVQMICGFCLILMGLKQINGGFFFFSFSPHRKLTAGHCSKWAPCLRACCGFGADVPCIRCGELESTRLQ